MSDDVVSDSPASHTRHRDSELGRRAFTPIYNRMKPGIPEDSGREPVRASPRSPGSTHKNQSGVSPRSPKQNKRTPRQQKNKLYPDLTGAEDEVDAASFKEEEDTDGVSDVDINDRENSFDQDLVDDKKKKKYNDSSPVIKRHQRKEPIDTGQSPRVRGRRNYIPEPESPQNVQDAPAQYDGIKPLILVVAVLAIVIGVIMFVNQESSDQQLGASPSVDYFKLFRPRLEKIREKYPSQTSRFWKVVSSSIKRLLTERIETYPAVLLFGIPETHSATGTCISKDIIKSLNDVFNSSEDGYINSSNLDSATPAKMKLDLDGKLIHSLKLGKGVVLDHVEKLPAQTALLLHGYCDGDNAPFKSVSIILGLHTENLLPDQDDIVEDILNDLWEGELGVDEMPALRSRIANSVAIVSPESGVNC